VRRIKSIIIRIPDEIHQSLRIKVIEQKTTIQELIAKYISDYVNSSDDKKIKQAAA